MLKIRIIKFFIFIFFLFISDRFIGNVLQTYFFKQNNEILSYSFSKLNSQILIMGNSRAQHHYDPRIISDSLKMSCYNLGIDGGHSILLPNVLTEIILKRYTPKIIIVEFNPDSQLAFLKDKSYDILFALLLPYYHSSPEIQQLVSDLRPFEKIKLFSSIYPFNSKIVNIIRFNTRTHAARKKDFLGFIPLKDVQINNSSIDTKNLSPCVQNIDTNYVKALKKIIHLCKLKGIKLFFINSPIYNNKFFTLPNSTSSNLFSKIISEEDITFFDFSNHPSFIGHPELFNDRAHLDGKGAKIFTRLISSAIANKIKEDSIKIQQNN